MHEEPAPLIRHDRWGRVGLAGVALAALIWGDAAHATTVELSGTKQLDQSTVTGVIGPVRGTDVDAFALAARQRIQEYYRDHGYSHARTWHRYDRDRDVVRIHIDEGRMAHVVIDGTGLVRSLVYRSHIELPADVYYDPEVAKLVETLQQRFDRARIIVEVEELRAMRETPLGDLVRERQLVIEVVTQESIGWRFGVQADSRYGLTPKLRLKKPELLNLNDRLDARLEIAIPFRQLVTQQDAKVQWVRGVLGAEYAFPKVTGDLAPVAELRGTLTREARTDIDVQDYLFGRVRALGGVELDLGAIRLGVTGGLFAYWVDGEDSEGESIDEQVTRGGLGLRGRFLVGTRLHDFDEPEAITLLVALQAGDGGVMVFAEATGNQHVEAGPFTLHFRQRLLWRGGEVRFWEHDSLEEHRYMRVFFGRYLRHGVQSDLVIGYDWTSRLSTSLFYDLSLFVDAAAEPGDWEIAHGFGPLIGTTLYDAVRVEMGYGFGWDEDGFEHNFQFSAATTF